MHKRKFLFIIFLILPYLLILYLFFWYNNKLNQIKGSTFVIINKSNYSLKLFKYTGELIFESKIALGKNPGNKIDKGDLKTPEGVFSIISIEDAKSWEHDFKDDTLGSIKGAYGPYFIRLNVPGQKGIGIHGTHDKYSIGTRASEGCIRMNNDDLIKLVEKINTTSVVAILPGIKDQIVNADTSKNNLKYKATINL